MSYGRPQDDYQRAGTAMTDGSAPPPGALLFYEHDPSGHVAVYLVQGAELTDGAWRLPYLSWATPLFGS